MVFPCLQEKMQLFLGAPVASVFPSLLGCDTQRMMTACRIQLLESCSNRCELTIKSPPFSLNLGSIFVDKVESYIHYDSNWFLNYSHILEV